MITWQDPVALALAALLVASAWLWRKALIQRGSAPHCTQCKADAVAPTPPKPATRVPLERMRLARKR